MTDPSGGLARRAVPLRQRRFDWVLLRFTKPLSLAVVEPAEA